MGAIQSSSHLARRLKANFNVPSDDQGSHPEEFSVSVNAAPLISDSGLSWF